MQQVPQECFDCSPHARMQRGRGGWAKRCVQFAEALCAARDDNLLVTHSLQPLACPWALEDERAAAELLMALRTRRRSLRTDSATQCSHSVARARSRWCANTISTQAGCGWRGLSCMFTITLMLQSLVHCVAAAAVRPELTPFSGSGAGELEEDPAPTQSTTTAPPSGGNRGTYASYH